MSAKKNPIRGKGERNMECPAYDECLDRAVLKNWEAFNCEECAYEDGEPELTTRSIDSVESLCTECGAKPRISPHVPYCASCMARRSNRPEARRKPHKRTKPKNAPVYLCKSKDPAQKEPTAHKETIGQKAALTIQFGKYGTVLKEVEKLAEEEMRPVDLQVIYMLKQHLQKRPNVV